MTIEKAVLSALAYHNIFDYPLTKEEIFMFLETKSNEMELKIALNKLIKKKKIKFLDEYFFLKNKSIVKKRKLKYVQSQKKQKKMQFYAKSLSLIPTVTFVGLTGALSMNNAKKNDDIDLLVISTKNSMWTTRFLSNIILLPFRRQPKSIKQNNRACLNIFLDENDLEIKQKNLYTAHELVQMVPVINKNKAYQRLINKNSWVFEFLPNWKIKEKVSKKSKIKKSPKFVENSLKKLQLNYMKSKRTQETIGRYQLFFHPINLQKKILQMHSKKIKSLTKNKSV